MKKNEPLKCARTISWVLGIGLFLFFFCFSLPVKAAAPPTIGATFKLNTANIYNQYQDTFVYKRIWKIDLDVACNNPMLVIASTQYGLTETSIYWNGYNTTKNTSTPQLAHTQGMATFIQSDTSLVEGYLETWQTIAQENIVLVTLVCGSASFAPIYEMGLFYGNPFTTGLAGNTMLLGFVRSYVTHWTGSSDNYFATTIENNAQVHGSEFTTIDPDHSHNMAFTGQEGFFWLHYFIITGGWTPTGFEDIDFEATWKLGNDYTLAKNVMCDRKDYCLYNFGYSYGVFSRSIASSTAVDLPNYPRFRWFWQSSDGEAIVSSTVRWFIDVGQTALNVQFAFPKPTSSPAQYVLQIEDPAVYESPQDFIVNVYFTTSTPDNIGWCDPKNFCPEDPPFLSQDGLFCAGQLALCYMFTPTQESLVYLSNQYDRIWDNFPLTIISDVFDDLNSAKNQSSTISAGVFIYPVVNTSTGGYNTASTSLVAPSEWNDVMEKIKYVQAGMMWLLTIALILGIIFIKI